MSKIPPNNQWFQPNTSDRLGSIYYSKNINLDEQGYLKLSNRSIKFMDEAESTNFGVPVAIGKYTDGGFQIGTTSNANYRATISTTARTFTEDTGSNNPTMTVDSHACYFNDKWHASDATDVYTKEFTEGGSDAWDSAVISSLTSGKRHYLEVFENRNSICVTNGSTVIQKDSAYSAGPTLTLPSDFETVGLVYNNNRMGVLTRPASSDTNKNAYFFVWSGASTSAEGGYDTGAEAIVSACPYKNSFLLLTRRGELLYFNGGGFDKLAEFPFSRTERRLSTPTSDIFYGDSMLPDGDIVLINTSFVFNGFGKKSERYMQGNPSGVWCYDPRVGLYHRYSPSISTAEVYSVSDANVNTSTEIMTVTSGTVPATGNPARYVRADTEIGGLSVGKDYWIIKVTDTTFKLATSKDNALVGTAIDLTSVGSGGTNEFYMYTILDYGASFGNNSGAVSPTGDTTLIYQEYLFGGDYDTTALATNDSLCVITPFLENRGYFVLPKIFSSEVTDTFGSVLVRYKPLDTNDKIIIKLKRKDVIGLPVATPTTGTEEGEYMAKNIIKSSQDFSEAKTHVDNGEPLELEVLGGAGAGQLVQVLSISESSGVYSFVLAENLDGVASGDKCHFIVDNFEKMGEITSSDSDGFKEILLDQSGKFALIKFELRGSEVTIEDIEYKPKNQIRKR